MSKTKTKTKTKTKFPGNIYVHRHVYNKQLVVGESLDQINDGSEVAVYKLVTTHVLTKVLRRSALSRGCRLINYDYEMLVEPQQLLRVRFVEPGQQLELHLVALACSYVLAVGANGHRQIAIEIVVDPTQPNPVTPYYCDPQQLHQYVIPPRFLRGVHPYLK